MKRLSNWWHEFTCPFDLSDIKWLAKGAARRQTAFMGAVERHDRAREIVLAREKDIEERKATGVRTTVKSVGTTHAFSTEALEAKEIGVALTAYDWKLADILGGGVMLEDVPPEAFCAAHDGRKHLTFKTKIVYDSTRNEIRVEPESGPLTLEWTERSQAGYILAGGALLYSTETGALLGFIEWPKGAISLAGSFTVDIGTVLVVANDDDPEHTADDMWAAEVYTMLCKIRDQKPIIRVNSGAGVDV